MRASFIAIAATLLLVGCASAPTITFTPAPTAAPTATPSTAPTATPSLAPTLAPTLTPSPAPATPSPRPPTTAAPWPPAGLVLGTADAPRVIEIASDDELTFFPNVIPVGEGETITFDITNNGDAVHEFMLGPLADAFADAEGTPEVADIAKGETKSLTFTFDGPGPYAFACHEPGHFEAGMLGYVIVNGPDVPVAGTVDNPRLIGIEMTDDLRFLPDQLAMTPGETVLFAITNEGSVTHEFVVGPADLVDADEIDGILVKEADEIETHHLKTVTYTFDGPGPYAFACHEPGHFEAGMRGTVLFVGP